MRRRHFLGNVLAAAAAASAQPLPLAAHAAAPASEPRITARLGKAIRVPNSAGDLWSATWADDGHLYVASDDTSAFDKKCDNNLSLSRLIGDDPARLRGETVNCMAQFGGGSETDARDGGMWKACGLTCVDGVLYMSVSRQLTCPTEPDGKWQGRFSPFWIQETWDASVIKSTDHGRTWSAKPKLGEAMFPGRLFSTPFFVQYGRNGEAGPHQSDQFVYAISNDGAWNNGNCMFLGRVRRDRIAALDARDWEFVHGYTAAGEPIWKSGHEDALYVFRSPNRASMTGLHYIAPLRLYILPQWHYPALDDPKRRWQVTRLEFYYAPAPWGPWTLFHQQDFEPESWYNPCIPAKFISADGLKFWISVAGDFLGNRGYYSLNFIPVTLTVPGGANTARRQSSRLLTTETLPV